MSLASDSSRTYSSVTETLCQGGRFGERRVGLRAWPPAGCRMCIAACVEDVDYWRRIKHCASHRVGLLPIRNIGCGSTRDDYNETTIAFSLDDNEYKFLQWLFLIDPK